MDTKENAISELMREVTMLKNTIYTYQEKVLELEKAIKEKDRNITFLQSCTDELQFTENKLKEEIAALKHHITRLEIAHNVGG
jgi:chromosome segregation ATPase